MNLFEHLPGCTPIRWCNHCLVAEKLRTKFNLGAIEAIASHLAAGTKNLLEHLPGCTTLETCNNCKVMAQLRGKFSEDEIKWILEKLGGGPVYKSFDELELSVRLQNCLRNENIITLGDAIERTASEYLKIPNFGRRVLNELRDVLEAHGLKLKGQ